MSPGLHSLAGDPVAACKHDCDAAARAAIRVERRRHRLADKACNGDINCHVEEDAMHAAILAEIESDKAACFVSCEHQQGAGTGGQ